MMRQMCKSKIHRATVTDANLHYVGSITIDQKLLEAADILPYEMVQVVNVNNGNRFETYAIEGPADSGVVCLNGAAARLAVPGDVVIIIAYGLFNNDEVKGWQPQVVHVNEKNQMIM